MKHWLRSEGTEYICYCVVGMTILRNKVIAEDLMKVVRLLILVLSTYTEVTLSQPCKWYFSSSNNSSVKPASRILGMGKINADPTCPDPIYVDIFEPSFSLGFNLIRLK